MVLAARNQPKAEAAVAAVAGRGVAAGFVPLDVAVEGSCRAAVAATVERFGRLDILVPNAGTSICNSPQDDIICEWRHVLEVNLCGASYWAQAPSADAARRRQDRRHRSRFSLFGSAYAVAYAASKRALVQMTKPLTAAWAADNIQVNAVPPGWTDTELTRDAGRQAKVCTR